MPPPLVSSHQTSIVCSLSSSCHKTCTPEQHPNAYQTNSPNSSTLPLLQEANPTHHRPHPLPHTNNNTIPLHRAVTPTHSHSMRRRLRNNSMRHHPNNSTSHHRAKHNRRPLISSIHNISSSR